MVEKAIGAAESGAFRSSLIDDISQGWFGIQLSDTALNQHHVTATGWSRVMRTVSDEMVLEAEPSSFMAALNSAAPGGSSVEPVGSVVEPNREVSGDLLAADLVEIAEAIRGRQVSSEEVTRASLARLEEAHQNYNLAVDIDAEAALAAARDADRAIAQGASAPLLGVPLAHKDLFYRSGRPVNCGAKLRAEHLPDVTATVLQRLDSAGALDLARLHMTEFAFVPTGGNSHYGPCRNPWDVDRLPGGSSSGSGVAVAARAVFGALGTDTGGSIRIPAALCGVTGLKPTYGRVSRAGGMPLSFSSDHIGPLARSARDCARLMSVLAGQDKADAASSAQPVPDYEGTLRAPIKGLRIGVPQAFFRAAVSGAIAEALDQSLRAFQDLGAIVREVPDFDYAELNALGSLVIRAEAVATHAAWLRDRPNDYSAAVRERLEEGLAIPAAIYVQALSTRGPRLSRYLQTVMAEVDVLHAPVSPIVAPLLDRVVRGGAEERQVMSDLTNMTRPFNFLGLPALTLPCGFVREGEVSLPTAFQLIGRPFDEVTLLRAGHAYQTSTDWHRSAPPKMTRQPPSKGLCA